MSLSLQYTEKYLFDSPEQCSECHNALIYDFDTNEMVCSVCGLVAARAMRIVPPHETKNTPYSFGQYGSRTRILLNNTDSSVTSNRLARSQDWSFINTQARNLHVAFGEINRLGSQLQVPRIILETAFLLYRKVYAQKVGMHAIKPKAAAILYLACRLHKFLIFLKEIAELSDYSLKMIERRVWVIQRDMGLKLPPLCPKKVIYRLSATLNVSFQTMVYALKFLQYLKERNLISGYSVPIAAAVVYLSCMEYNEPRPQWLIAGAVHLCDVTVRSTVKQLRKELRYFSLRRRADL